MIPLQFTYNNNKRLQFTYNNNQSVKKKFMNFLPWIKQEIVGFFKKER